MIFELSDRFHDDERIVAANRHSKAAVGLFVLSLSWMTKLGWATDSSRFFPEPIGWMYLLESPKRPVTRRPFNALVRAGLWTPIINRKGKMRGGWRLAGKGDLWRIAPDREPIPQWMRSAVKKRDGRVCQLCFGHIPNGGVIHLDHVIPVAHGGRSTLDNLQVTHAVCNLRKGARVLGGAA